MSFVPRITCAAALVCASQALAQSPIFFSEYVEGTSNNKALEVFNPTAAAVDLSSYRIELFSNGSPTATTTSPLTGTLAAGSAVVYRNSGATGSVPGTDLPAINFNGDDAVRLVYVPSATVVDRIGQVGVDPGAAWVSGSLSTVDRTLRRKRGVCSGDPNSTLPFNVALEWDGFAVDTFGDLGVHGASCVTFYDTICAGVANSNGSGATLSAAGSDIASAGNVVLTVAGLPTAGTTAMLFNSRTATTTIFNPGSGGSPSNPGGVASDGNICIGGGTFGRHFQQIWMGTSGTFDLALNLNNIPFPEGPGDYSAVVMAGQTWYWQCWYRDAVLGPGRSNFSAAIGITFR